MTNNRTLIIVEGQSDKMFLDGLIKHRKKQNKFSVYPIKKITNKSKVHNYIEDALADGYKKIFILLDLNTLKPNTQNYFSCHPELCQHYSSNILGEYSDNQKVKIIVSVRDLEAWELLAFENKNSETMKNTKNKLNDKINKNKNLTKTMITQHILKYLSKIIANANYNKSFEYFIQKTGV